MACSVAVLGLFTSCGTGSDADGARQELPGTAEPSTFQVTNDVHLEGLGWPQWGAQTANGTGTLKINTCEPDCAEGTTRVVQGPRLQVRGIGIDQGQRYYQQ